jgi:hypothetical protein
MIHTVHRHIRVHAHMLAAVVLTGPPHTVHVSTRYQGHRRTSKPTLVQPSTGHMLAPDTHNCALTAAPLRRPAQHPPHQDCVHHWPRLLQL